MLCVSRYGYFQVGLVTSFDVDLFDICFPSDPEQLLRL